MAEAFEHDRRDSSASAFTVLLALGDTARVDAWPDDAATAVELVGGRIARRVGWHEIADAVSDYSGDLVIVLDAHGVSDDRIATALAEIDEPTRARDAAVVAAFGEDQIDIVAAGLAGCRAQLLCAPSASDWLAALVVAREAARAVALHDRVWEGAAARLARLNEEVARIAEVLARLSRDEGQAAEDVGHAVGDRRTPYGGASADAPAITAEAVRHAIRARRLRDRFFGQGLFEDPAWDMMLDLFAAHLERAQVSVSSLCIAAAVAPTTALRWIGKLTDVGLFVRNADTFDRRRAFVALAPEAVNGMHGYLAAVRDGGLALA